MERGERMASGGWWEWFRHLVWGRGGARPLPPYDRYAAGAINRAVEELARVESTGRIL